MTTEPKKFLRLERRKLKRMHSGKKPYNTLEEKQELTRLVDRKIAMRAKVLIVFGVSSDGHLVLAEYNEHPGVFTMKQLHGIRDAYLSGGENAALLKYQELLLQYETVIQENNRATSEDTSTDGVPVYI